MARRARTGDLGDAVFRGIVGTRAVKSMATEPRTFRDAVDYWLARAGSVSGAARLAGVPRRTYRDWLTGARPRDPQRAAGIVRGAILDDRRTRLPRSRERRLRAADVADAQLVGRYNYDSAATQLGSANTDRRVDIGKYMADDAIGELVDAYLAGAGAEELRELFASLVTEDPTDFYRSTLRRDPGDDHGWTVRSFHPFGGAPNP